MRDHVQVKRIITTIALCFSIGLSPVVSGAQESKTEIKPDEGLLSVAEVMQAINGSALATVEDLDPKKISENPKSLRLITKNNGAGREIYLCREKSHLDKNCLLLGGKSFTFEQVGRLADDFSTNLDRAIRQGIDPNNLPLEIRDKAISRGEIAAIIGGGITAGLGMLTTYGAGLSGAGVHPVAATFIAFSLMTYGTVKGAFSVAKKSATTSYVNHRIGYIRNLVGSIQYPYEHTIYFLPTVANLAFITYLKTRIEVLAMHYSVVKPEPAEMAADGADGNEKTVPRGTPGSTDIFQMY